MKIALPVFHNRISPVFDTSQRILVLDIENGSECSRDEHPLTETAMGRRVAYLSGLGIQVLLCGAISKPMADMLQAAEIQVIPFIAGEVEQVLEGYKTQKLGDARFQMPGCCRGRQRRLRGRGRRNCQKLF